MIRHSSLADYSIETVATLCWANVIGSAPDTSLFAEAWFAILVFKLTERRTHDFRLPLELRAERIVTLFGWLRKRDAGSIPLLLAHDVSNLPFIHQVFVCGRIKGSWCSLDRPISHRTLNMIRALSALLVVATFSVQLALGAVVVVSLPCRGAEIHD